MSFLIVVVVCVHMHVYTHAQSNSCMGGVDRNCNGNGNSTGQLTVKRTRLSLNEGGHCTTRDSMLEKVSPPSVLE